MQEQVANICADVHVQYVYIMSKASWHVKTGAACPMSPDDCCETCNDKL